MIYAEEDTQTIFQKEQETLVPLFINTLPFWCILLIFVFILGEGIGLVVDFSITKCTLWDKERAEGNWSILLNLFCSLSSLLYLQY